MTGSKQFGLAVCVGFAVGLGLSPALAADVATTQFGPAFEAAEVVTPSGWSFTVAPYGWLAGISGEVTLGQLPPVDFDVTFGDILKKFDIGGMVVGEARYDRFGIFSDFIYVKLSATHDTPLGILANQVGVTNSTLIWTAAGEYRFVETPTVSVDALAGFRLWSVDTELDFVGGALGGTSRSASKSWVDPLVGMKATAELTSRFYLTGWGMIGGFGAGSDFMWDVWAGAGYRFTDHFSMLAGYRALGVDYSANRFSFDAVEHGPVIGAVFSF